MSPVSCHIHPIVTDEECSHFTLIVFKGFQSHMWGATVEFTTISICTPEKMRRANESFVKQTHPVDVFSSKQSKQRLMILKHCCTRSVNKLSKRHCDFHSAAALEVKIKKEQMSSWVVVFHLRLRRCFANHWQIGVVIHRAAHPSKSVFLIRNNGCFLLDACLSWTFSYVCLSLCACINTQTWLPGAFSLLLMYAVS